MALFTAFNISASGMTAERFRTDIIAQNIANVEKILINFPPIHVQTNLFSVSIFLNYSVASLLSF